MACKHDNSTTTTNTKKENFETIIEKVKCDDCKAVGEFIFTLTDEIWEDED